jgi:hypothetical protein
MVGASFVWPRCYNRVASVLLAPHLLVSSVLYVLLIICGASSVDVNYFAKNSIMAKSIALNSISENYVNSF